MTVKNFNNISNVLRDAAKVVAAKSMNAAGYDFKNSNDGDFHDIGVSVDGSWQTWIFLPEWCRGQLTTAVWRGGGGL